MNETSVVGKNWIEMTQLGLLSLIFSLKTGAFLIKGN